MGDVSEEISNPALAADATETPLPTESPTMEAITDKVEPTATEETSGGGAAAEDAVAMVPTPRADLYATDPAIVNLASGEVQLIEMFAFW